jgi:hypothetical protein
MPLEHHLLSHTLLSHLMARLSPRLKWGIQQVLHRRSLQHGLLVQFMLHLTHLRPQAPISPKVCNKRENLRHL